MDCDPASESRDTTHESTSRTAIKATRRHWVKGLGAAGLAATAGCSTSSGGGSGSDSGKFVLGLDAPLSGGNSLIGQNMQRTLQIAVDEINENGGIHGQQVAIEAVDDQSSPQTAVQKVNQLINQSGADAIIGTVSSAVRNSVSPVCQNNNVPLLYPTQYEGTAAPDYCNPYLVKTSWVPTQQVKPSVPYLMENYGTSFYLLGSDYLWPQEMNKAISSRVKENGGTVVAEKYVQLGTTDFSSVLTDIGNKNPDVLLMTLVGTSVPAIQKQLYNNGMRKNLTEVGFGHSVASLAGLSPETAEGVVNIMGYHNNMQNEANQQFMQKFNNRYGDNEDALVDGIAGGTYWTAKMMEKSYSQGEDTSAQTLLDDFSGMTYDSIAGELTVPYDQQVKIGCVAATVNSDVEYETDTKFEPAMPDDACSDI
ncbi:substrate-binding protein [Halarchaeum acidiphilum]|nr:substrate-binding protein [Halarchaeum acidiphilum]